MISVTCSSEHRWRNGSCDATAQRSPRKYANEKKRRKPESRTSVTQVYIQQANNDVFTQSSEHTHKHIPCTHTVDTNTHTHTHTVVNTHTHTHTWSSRGFGALIKGVTSVVDNFCRSRDLSPQPQVTSLTLYPLEPRLPPPHD